MVEIVFYEKPGCMNNTRQKQLLSDSGHVVLARNILTEVWTTEKLRPFFRNHSVAEWFNRSAPRIKSGEVIPEALDEVQALALMCADPLLIRRPLMSANGRQDVGFITENVEKWVGLASAPPISEGCPRDDGRSCTPKS